MVKGWLASAFPDCEIVDKSSTAAESDVHVIRPNGDFIAIECKNKNSITIQDVEKSMRDIAFLRDKYGGHFIGYLFISLRSTNIPRKGAGTLEVFDDSVPVYWYGQHDFDEANNAAIDYARALWAIGYNVKNLHAKFSNHNRAMQEFQKQMDELIADNKACLDRLLQNQRAVASLIASAKTIQDNNNVAIQLLGNHASVSHASTPLVPTQAITSIASHKCPKCDKSFARKAELTKHLKGPCM